MGANILNRRGFAMGVGAGVAALTLPAALRPVIAADAAPVARSVDDIFIAVNVPVDVTAATVTDARDRGLVQGRVNGLRQVLERLVGKEDIARVPTLSSTQVIDMVRDFSIASERSSAVRYIAELTVRFDPNAVRRLLRNAGIPFAETLSKPLVVVPVLSEGARALLWEDNNAWRLAWNRINVTGLVPLIVPPGEPKDISAITADQALAKDVGAVRTLASLYDAGGALIVVATLSGPTVQAVATEIRPGLPNQEFTRSQGAEGGDDALTASARAIAAEIQDAWRERNRVVAGTTGQVTALVPITALKDWLTVRDSLTNVSLIERVDLQALTRDRAQVTLYFAGAQDQLRLALAQRDLMLAQQGGVWIISRSGAAHAAQ
ncbi:MAG: DUF2066 domain-containing protein [Candidatus Binataceae bacterium]